MEKVKEKTFKEINEFLNVEELKEIGLEYPDESEIENFKKVSAELTSFYARKIDEVKKQIDNIEKEKNKFRNLEDFKKGDGTDENKSDLDIINKYLHKEMFSGEKFLTEQDIAKELDREKGSLGKYCEKNKSEISKDLKEYKKYLERRQTELNDLMDYSENYLKKVIEGKKKFDRRIKELEDLKKKEYDKYLKKCEKIREKINNNIKNYEDNISTDNAKEVEFQKKMEEYDTKNFLLETNINSFYNELKNRQEVVKKYYRSAFMKAFCIGGIIGVVFEWIHVEIKKEEGYIIK
jgi:peptidoglycan hydrolase CwlO-like protein